MSLKSFKTVTRHIGGRTRRVNHLKEEIEDFDIWAVKVIAVGSNASSVEREVSIAEFIEAVKAMNESNMAMILTAIAV